MKVNVCTNMRMCVRVLGGGRKPRDLTMTYEPRSMTYQPHPMTHEVMHALVDRSDVGLSPRVVREAEELLQDCFDVGVRAWRYLRSHEREMWNKSKYD